LVAHSEAGCFVTDGLFYLHAALPFGSMFQTLTRMVGISPDAPLDDIVGAEPIESRASGLGSMPTEIWLSVLRRQSITERERRAAAGRGAPRWSPPTPREDHDHP
jgi:hypothetical protein